MTIEFAYGELPHQSFGSLKLHYAFSGKPAHKKNAKPLLLCLHGFPEFWYTWHHQLEQLSKDYFVVAPDMRGFNKSDKPQGVEAYTMSELVNDIKLFIEHLGYKKVFLVAHDWGGLVSWTFATLYPELLNKLVIINSPHPRVYQKVLSYDQQQIKSSQYITKFLDASANAKLSSNNYDLLWRFAFNELVEKGVFSDQQKSIYKEAWAHTGALEATLNYYRAESFEVPPLNAKLPYTFSKELPMANQIHTETLVLWGMDDTALSPECLSGLGDYVANLKIVPIANAGHCVIHEYPNIISEHISNFISR